MSTIVYGGTGLLGSAIVRALGPNNVIEASSIDCDLRDPEAVYEHMRYYTPTMIYMCAGLVGGIKSNSEMQFKFLHENATMALNVIEAARSFKVKNLAYMSSSCAYPIVPPGRLIQEIDMTNGCGKLEPTNRGYAMAKLLGTELCAIARSEGLNYKTFVPCNLYGPGDNYTEGGHVFAALIKKFVEATVHGDSVVTIWGDGSPRREFLHSDDAASGIIFGFEHVDMDIINIGYGVDITIRDLAEKIALKAGYKGKIEYTGELNGVKQKLMSSFYMRKAGWKPKIDLDEGIEEVIDDYKERVRT